MKIRSKVSVLIVVGSSFFATAVQSQLPDVQVLVHGVHFGGQVVYRYQVRNNSASAIDAVTLGVPSPGKELPAIPWVGVQGLSDVPAEVPPALCRPFINMSCAVGLFQFDYMNAPRAVIEMQGRELTQVPAPASFAKPELIQPRTTSSVAEVVSPQRLVGYMTASASVRFFNNFPKTSSGAPIVEFEVPLTKADVVPPSITGTADARKSGGMLEVALKLSVTDNMDQNPAVFLESVTSNEPLNPRDVVAAIGADTRVIQLKRNKGRIYYLTYRAIDGSENSSTVVISVSGELP